MKRLRFSLLLGLAALLAPAAPAQRNAPASVSLAPARPLIPANPSLGSLPVQPGPLQPNLAQPSLVRRIQAAGPRRASLNVNTLLSLSATPSSINLTLTPGGVATASTPIAITSSLLNALLTTVTVYAWLPSAGSALSAPDGSAIPSSCIYGQVSTGLPTSPTVFAQASPFGPAGTGLKLLNLKNIVSSLLETDNLYLSVDLTSRPQQPAGTYTGYIYIEAQAL